MWFVCCCRLFVVCRLLFVWFEVVGCRRSLLVDRCVLIVCSFLLFGMDYVLFVVLVVFMIVVVVVCVVRYVFAVVVACCVLCLFLV